MQPRSLLVLSLALIVHALMVPAARAQHPRCLTPSRLPMPVGAPLGVAPEDCGYWTNVPEPDYEPSAGCLYEIQVVFHVLQHANGDGFVSADTIQDQIDVLNEDLQAIPGTPGAPGRNAKIRFRLATTDPAGNPTTGITYTTDNRWFNDRGNYWDTLTWDSNRYMNVYTNEASGAYGYVSGFASEGNLVGEPDDYIVINWQTVGRDPTAWWPGNMGRTGTHEVGHYLGLYHTFEGGCGDPMDCQGTSDLICDTNPQDAATSGCPVMQSTCGSPDPTQNYMDYTDDACIHEFTAEQVRRARCTLQHWRPDAYTLICNELDCADGLDDDGDGDVDCDDLDCASIPPCGSSEDCANGVDDDGDGLIDCDDPDCLVDDMSDCDGDGVPNGVDCQPANPSVSLPPDEVDRLQVTNPGNGDAELSWSPVANATSYGLLSGLLSDLWASRLGTASGSCALGGDQTSSPHVDAQRPPGSSDGHWYVVRAQNPCPGSYGFQSDLVERPASATTDCR